MRRSTRCSPPTATHWRSIALRTILQIGNAEFPVPLVQRADGIEKLLPAMKSEIAEFLGPGLALEAVELLALNLERVADAGIQPSTA